jgi:hypothetical protein
VSDGGGVITIGVQIWCDESSCEANYQGYPHWILDAQPTIDSWSMVADVQWTVSDAIATGHWTRVLGAKGDKHYCPLHHPKEGTA